MDMSEQKKMWWKIKGEIENKLYMKKNELTTGDGNSRVVVSFWNGNHVTFKVYHDANVRVSANSDGGTFCGCACKRDRY